MVGRCLVLTVWSGALRQTECRKRESESGYTLTTSHMNGDV